MKTLSHNTKHCSRFAAIRLQDMSTNWSGFTVKYGPNTGLEGRMQEVRG